jgi:hypothetical protein
MLSLVARGILYLGTVFEPPVRFIVRPLRHLGRRLPWRDVQNGPAFECNLVIFEMQAKGGRIIAATLSAPAPVGRKPLPDLFEPVLVGV